MTHLVVPSPVGCLRIEAEGGAIIAVTPTDEAPSRSDDRLLNACAAKLQAYFAGRLTNFSVPLAPRGTPFQQTVWRELGRIPYGGTTTYGAIARAVGKPKAARAVGQAVHRNPVAILIPCHRVIGANGFVSGYAWGPGMKARLLALEAAHRPNG